MRYFTLAEAESLIPELEKIFQAIREINPKAEAKMRLIEKMEADGSPKLADLAIERAQLEFLVNGMNAWFQGIMDLGAMPKGIDPALVDFPCRIDGREIYLCWVLGEKTITHYHGLEEGFAGRRPLPKPKLS